MTTWSKRGRSCCFTRHEDMRPAPSTVATMADEARPPAPAPVRARRAAPSRGDLRADRAPAEQPMIPWSPRRFIAILLGLFVLNWLIVAVFAPPENKIRVPYNPTFLTRGPRTGTSRRSRPAATRSRASSRRRSPTRATRRPASRPRSRPSPTGSSSRACSRRRTSSINAEPPGERSLLADAPVLASARRSCWSRCSSSCSPGARPAAAGGGGVLGQFGRSPGAAGRVGDPGRQLQRRGRHRGGRGGARRGRGLPEEPGASTAASARASRAACCWPGAPGTGKTLLARAVAGEARRAVLLGVGVGVHRGDRGHRRLARARPLQAGQGGRPGDHLHRRARRDRPLARRQRRRRSAATTSASRRSTRSSPRWTASTRTRT